MRKHRLIGSRAFLVLLGLALPALCAAQEYGPTDREQPGDEMIQAWLRQETSRLEARFTEDLRSREDWERERPRYREEYLHMLGLAPLPEKTPLHATVTGTLAEDGYVVDLLHYQSRPKLYVTANLYRPAKIEPGQRLPAVLYVCGHSNQGRDGNKTAYQAHGIWLARHGYVCLTVDTLQLGEIAATHHGTYNLERWWWHARGYTPAGVECWNGVRGIDYLLSRPDVDPQRIAVSGISGGGAATFWIAAADERVRVAVPVSGMADLESYVSNRVINGHCDCMFLYNTFQWPWTRIAGLIAPRPLLFANSDQDKIFPMNANERVINRLERLYSLSGNSDHVDALVSVGGHAYRQDLRQGIFRFLNLHLQNDPRQVTDSEVDIVTGLNRRPIYPIEPGRLRVFATDADLPTDQVNSRVDESFVPLGQAGEPPAGEYESWRKVLLGELRRVSFGALPARIEPAKKEQALPAGHEWLTTEPGIQVHVQFAAESPPADCDRVLLAVAGEQEGEGLPAWLREIAGERDLVCVCRPRGVGETRWTRKNPPNTVERSHVLLGRTVDTGRIWDLAAAARYVRDSDRLGPAAGRLPVWVAGAGGAGLVAVYAALWEADIAGAIILDPPLSHQDQAAPRVLNVLRVCDVPQVLGLLAPRPLTVVGTPREMLATTQAIYDAAGAGPRLHFRPRAAVSPKSN